MKVPPAETPDADQALCLAFGREVTRRILAGEIAKEQLGAASPETVRAFHFPAQ